jgi:hypothetical protein
VNPLGVGGGIGEEEQREKARYKNHRDWPKPNTVQGKQRMELDRMDLLR